jgi:hypothetical protein
MKDAKLMPVSVMTVPMMMISESIHPGPVTP